MPYVSTLLGKPVTDAEGNRIGRLQDLVASLRGGMPHPMVVALAIQSAQGLRLIPISAVAALVAPAIPLRCRLQDLPSYVPGEQELCLARDVLDKQIIDTDGARVVRVNDLELARINHHFYVANVDIGGLGLLRRLGLLGLVEKIAHWLKRPLRSISISWDAVELLPGQNSMRLKVPGEKLAELHPADLAEIISDLSRTEGSRFIETLDVKTLADTLEEIEPDFQASLIEAMPDEKVADVLEEMAPDEAADLLAELPRERSRELLELMEDEEAEDVRKLLAYPEDTAGGIMNTEFVAVRPNLTAEEAMAVLRETAREAETIYYVYVTDEEGHLLGVFSLQDLVLASPKMPVTDFMHRRVISVHLRDSQDKVAQIVAKYNLLAVPVVDDEGRMHGIVTADDALDKIIPTAWKKRLPKMWG